MQSSPELPRSERSAQQSNSTSLSQAELVCNNCINRHMIDERTAKKQQELEKETALERENAANMLRKQQEEEAAEIRRKEQFRQEANAHWAESKKLKDKQREGSLV